MTDGIPSNGIEDREDAKRPVERLVVLPADTELVELVKYLVANIGHPVGMGIEPSDKQAETIVKAVRKYDAEFDVKQAGETATIPVDVVGAQNKL